MSALVVQQLRPGASAYNELLRLGALPQEISNFRETFHQSGKNSVDAFLEHRVDLMRIGKLATAHILIERENIGKLFTYESSWLRELYGRMNSRFDTFANNRLSFITFNYDRTVEQFLFSSLSNTYGEDEPAVKAVMDHIPVVHLHGRLGTLPWQGGQSRPYETSCDGDNLKIAADNIKIIHEDISDGRDGDFAQTKKLLAAADQILLMGFGYNPTNVQRLGIADLPEGIIIGSCVGLGPKDETSAREVTAGKVRLMGGDCTHFVREVMRWK